MYSEYRRVDAQGNLLKQDEGGEPREILSPVLARNATASFRVVVSMPAGEYIWLDLGTNPDDVVQFTAYEEDANGGLKQAPIPWKKRLDAGATTAAIWLDIKVPRNAVVDRIKIEPALHFQGHWITYPMEARIAQATVPLLKPSPAVRFDYKGPASASGVALLREKFCGTGPPSPAEGLTSWTLSRRNTQQDIALAGSSLPGILLRVTKAKTISEWCQAGSANESNPEWLLRLRELIIQANGRVP